MRRQGGFTTIEVLVVSVIGGIVLAGAFRLWKSTQEESHRLQSEVGRFLNSVRAA